MYEYIYINVIDFVLQIIDFEEIILLCKCFIEYKKDQAWKADRLQKISRNMFLT